jgi:uncharacterized membrane protein YcaP (DUF421 family)
MVTLGASVAVAMQVPEGGVLLGFVVLTCALLFERSISMLTIKSEQFEKISQGCADMLVKDGVLLLDKLQDTRITRQQLFAALRNDEIYNLGKVERLYLEAGGGFSIYKAPGDCLPGLPVFPPDDKEVLSIQKKSEEMKACTNCGFTVKHDSEDTCNNCNSQQWTTAIL